MQIIEKLPAHHAYNASLSLVAKLSTANLNSELHFNAVQLSVFDYRIGGGRGLVLFFCVLHYNILERMHDSFRMVSTRTDAAGEGGVSFYGNDQTRLINRPKSRAIGETRLPSRVDG